MSDQNPYSESASTYQQPAQPQGSRSTLVLIVIACVGGFSLLICCGLVGLMLPAVQSAREAARCMQCSNNCKQIVLALHNYHSAYGSLPPAYTTDEQGRPLHSWRALILPFMEQQALHSQIDFSKPWNDPVNRPIADTVVPAYLCPSTTIDSTSTSYVAVVHPSGMMSGPDPVSFPEVTDGISNTVLVVEADSSMAVPWMSPQDIDLNAFQRIGSSRDAGGHFGGAHILLGDGSVRFLTDSVSSEHREALITKDGQDDVGVGTL